MSHPLNNGNKTAVQHSTTFLLPLYLLVSSPKILFVTMYITTAVTISLYMWVACHLVLALFLSM
jgi:hypothetical protein